MKFRHFRRSQDKIRPTNRPAKHFASHLSKTLRYLKMKRASVQAPTTRLFGFMWETSVHLKRLNARAHGCWVVLKLMCTGSSVRCKTLIQKRLSWPTRCSPVVSGASVFSFTHTTWFHRCSFPKRLIASIESRKRALSVGLVETPLKMVTDCPRNCKVPLRFILPPGSR